MYVYDTDFRKEVKTGWYVTKSVRRYQLWSRANIYALNFMIACWKKVETRRLKFLSNSIGCRDDSLKRTETMCIHVDRDSNPFSLVPCHSIVAYRCFCYTDVQLDCIGCQWHRTGPFWVPALCTFLCSFNPSFIRTFIKFLAGKVVLRHKLIKVCG